MITDGLSLHSDQRDVREDEHFRVGRRRYVKVTRESYILRDSVDWQSLNAMKPVERRLCNYKATEEDQRGDGYPL